MPRPLDAVYLGALAALSPWLAWRSRRGGRSLWTLLDRALGRVGRLSNPTPDDGPTVWFHGVSLGEIHLLHALVSAFRERQPAARCIVSSTTPAGLAAARDKFTGLDVIHWPLDFSWAVRRAFDAVRPDLVVLAEGDVWPNFLAEARRRGVPVVVVNARLSPKSGRRYQFFGPLVRPLLFDRVGHFAASSQETADALRGLGVGANRLTLTGSVKFDNARLDRDEPQTRRLTDLLAVRPGQTVWVAGSTQAPEEQAALDIYRRLRPARPGLRLVLVPRAPERFGEVTRLVERASLACVRRSQLVDPVADPSAVVVWDTTGELSRVWAAADVAFVGGSLDGKRGGQNLLEPAAYGSAVVVGPHVWNFREAVARLVAAGGAVQVNTVVELGAVVERLVGDAAGRSRMGEAAREFVRSQQGATARTLEVIERYLPRSRDGGPACHETNCGV